MLALFALLGCAPPSAPGVDGDTSSEDGPEASTPDRVWTSTRLGQASFGLQARMARSAEGTLAVAAYANNAEADGTCDDEDGTTLQRQTIHVALRAPGGSWEVEQAAAPAVPLSPYGLDLSFDPAGRPAIAYAGGEPEDNWCGGHDAVLAVRDDATWTEQTAAMESDDAWSGDEASDAGFVVGLWPALAFDTQGHAALLYRDAHYGSIQHDDRIRSDAELAWSDGSAWSHQVVDLGDGAQDYGDLAFDDDGRPVAAYAITVEATQDSRYGVWAARLEDGDWSHVQLYAGGIHTEVALALSPATGLPSVAFYAQREEAAVVVTLADDGAFADPDAWTTERVATPGYDEGRNVALAFDETGEPALAYHRCRRATSAGTDCDLNDEAAVFASRHEGSWVYETVATGSLGSCGDQTALAFDTDGRPHVFYRCLVEQDGDYALWPFVATPEG